MVCPDLIIDVRFIEESEDDMSSDSSSQSEMSIDSEEDVDPPASPANAEQNGNLQESHQPEQDWDKCSICLDQMLPSMPVIRTPCDHSFHQGCLMEWVAIQPVCPLCRSAF